MRRGARVAESGSLENCCPGNGTVGSIPTLSAKPSRLVPTASLARLSCSFGFLVEPNLTRSTCLAFHLRLFLQGTSEFDHRQGISRAVSQQGLFNRRPLDPIRFDKDHAVILTGGMPSLFDRQIVIGK